MIIKGELKMKFKVEQTFDTKDTMLKYLGMSKKEYKDIIGE